MTPTEVKQSADEMVQMFFKELENNDCYCTFWGGERDYDETKCAAISLSIAHCKRVINEITWWHDTTSYETTMDFEGAERRINHYRLILSELEGRVK